MMKYMDYYWMCIFMADKKFLRGCLVIYSITGVCTAEYDGTAEYGFWHFEHNFCSK